jgi:hypothetical protein
LIILNGASHDAERRGRRSLRIFVIYNVIRRAGVYSCRNKSYGRTVFAHKFYP